MDSRVRHKNDTYKKQAFTLIALSIVLVIIGLIVGGVLVGQDLIKAAYARAQVSQIEKFNTAVNTFYGKYGALPGDMNATIATNFGFTARGQYAGEGDGNGILEGILWNAAGENDGIVQGTGESAMFWVDLSSAVAGNLIEGGFTATSPDIVPGADITGTGINLYLPSAKIGSGNYIYVKLVPGVGPEKIPSFEVTVVKPPSIRPPAALLLKSTQTIRGSPHWIELLVPNVAPLPSIYPFPSPPCPW